MTQRLLMMAHVSLMLHVAVTYAVADTWPSNLPDGRVYLSTITLDMEKNSPRWLEKCDSPPVSARSAIRLANDVLNEIVGPTTTLRGWVIRESPRVSLAPLNEEGLWFWVVRYTWRPEVGGMTGIPFSFDVLVLMDGSAVKPKRVEGER